VYRAVRESDLLAHAGALPKRHWFKDEEFEALFERLPRELDAVLFRRAFLHSKFWADYYGLAK